MSSRSSNKDPQKGHCVSMEAQEGGKDIKTADDVWTRKCFQKTEGWM